MDKLGNLDWILENERRVAYLERLYDLADRSNPSAPNYHTYTGLYIQRQKMLMELDRMEQLK
jgi:hypothetical protein